MNRTTATGYVDIGGGRHGARDEDLAGGIAGTEIASVDYNAMQEEGMALVEGTGQQGDATIAAQQLIGLRRAAGLNVTVVTATSTLVADNAGLVLVNAAGGNITLTLPAGAALKPVKTGSNTQSPAVGLNPTSGGSAPTTTDAHALTFELCRTDDSTHTVSFVAAGSDSIEGASSDTLAPGDRKLIKSDGGSPATWRRLVGNTGRGTLIALGASQSIPNAVETAVSWPAPTIDTDAMWASGSPTILTVPAGVGRVRVTAQTTWTNNASGSRKFRVVRNGVDEGVGFPAMRLLAAGSTDVTILSAAGGIRAVSPGDTIQLLVFQDSGGALNLLGTNTWISVEFLK